MKSLPRLGKALSLLLAVGILLLGGQVGSPIQRISHGDALRLNKELKSLEGLGYTLRRLNGEILEIEHPITRESERRSLQSYSSRLPKYPNLPTLTINLNTIDTSFYSRKYRYLNSVDCTSGRGLRLISADLNHNSRRELYGLYREQNQGQATTRIYELDTNRNWQNTYVYQMPIGYVSAIADLDEDGLYELFARSSNFVFAMEQPSNNEYPTRFSFSFRVSVDGGYGIPMEMTDIDGDSIGELIYRGSELDSSGNTFQKIFVARYQRNNNSFTNIWGAQLPPGCVGGECSSNFAIGDPDDDGHKDIITSSFDGHCYVIEHTNSDSFEIAWRDSLSAAGRVCSGDIDGNGVEEFIIGGNQPESDGYVHLRAYAYEKIADDSYRPYFGFDIYPVGYFYPDLYQAVDIDNDGQKELLLSFQGGNIIVKGVRAHSYHLFYYKFLPQSDGMSIADVTGSKTPELLLSTFEANNQILTRARVYELDTLQTSVGETPIHSLREMYLDQNYPNPFNSQTRIIFYLPVEAYVRLTVFNIQGKEVITLVDGRMSSGIHTIQFNPSSDNVTVNLGSGVYVLSLVSGDKKLARKLVLVR